MSAVSTLHISPDADDVPTLWRDTEAQPVALARKCDMNAEAWALLVVGLLVTRWEVEE